MSASATGAVPTTAQTLHGHCACGHARFTLRLSAGAPELQRRAACHCSTCSRINGAPYIWTTHWDVAAVSWLGEDEPKPDGSKRERPDLGERIQTWESMPGRKWKLRCAKCGSPLGTWSKARGTYSIWPSTLEREGKTDENTVGTLKGLEFLRPTEHQFYGPWRTTNVYDDLPKWVGYAHKSQQVDNEGRPIGPPYVPDEAKA